jgi:lipid-binding SYLF domain-containing protein
MKTLTRFCTVIALGFAALAAVPPAFAQQSTLSPAAKESERKARLQLASDGLEKLYKVQPDSKATVEKAVGYAVFEVNSIYAILFVGQRGQGVLVDNASKKPTFMTSSRVGTGPGVGKQKVYLVFVFKDRAAMDQFIAVGDAGADVGASISTGTGGMTRSFNPLIEIYQIPESGMALQASWGGTLYTVDPEL